MSLSIMITGTTNQNLQIFSERMLEGHLREALFVLLALVVHFPSVEGYTCVFVDTVPFFRRATAGSVVWSLQWVWKAEVCLCCTEPWGLESQLGQLQLTNDFNLEHPEPSADPK